MGVDLHPHNLHARAKVLCALAGAYRRRTLAPGVDLRRGQEVFFPVLAELRLLSSTRLDSHLLLTVVLAGDGVPLISVPKVPVAGGRFSREFRGDHL